VVIDMAQADGQRLIQQLAVKSDVLVENFKVGGLKKYGLGSLFLCCCLFVRFTCELTTYSLYLQTTNL